jgi:hypothetical protein
LSEIDTGVSSPEDELVRAELDEARRKRRTGRARIVGTLVSVAVGLVAAGASVVGRKPGETAGTKPATEASRLSGRGRSRPG